MKKPDQPVLFGISIVLYLALAYAVLMILMGLMQFKVITQEYSFKETTCMVLDKKLEKFQKSANIVPIVDVQYEANNTFQNGKAAETAKNEVYNKLQAEKILDGYVVRQSYPCWHSEKDPSIVVFHKTNALDELIKHIVASLVIIILIFYVRKKSRPATVPVK